MVKYICDRCDYSTHRKGNFKNHIFRKYVCKIKNKDIDIEIIRKKYVLTDDQIYHNYNYFWEKRYKWLSDSTIKAETNKSFGSMTFDN